MAEWKDGRYICGRQTNHPDGTSTDCRLSPVIGGKWCHIHTPKSLRPTRLTSGARISKSGAILSEKGYKRLLPEGLALHYNEDDPDLMSLRSKAALLEAFIRSTVESFDSEGAAVDSKLIRFNAMQLVPVCCQEPYKTYLNNIVNELGRASQQEALQIKARKLVQEFTEIVKAENQRLAAIGGLISMDQFGAVINGIMTIAIKMMGSEDFIALSHADKARQLIKVVKKEVISFPTMEEQTQPLQEAASIQVKDNNEPTFPKLERPTQRVQQPNHFPQPDLEFYSEDDND